jgi:hypothetical protein
MSDELRKRIEKLQTRLNAERSGPLPPRDPLRIVTVFGGLLPEPIFGSSGSLEWIREPDETLASFVQRSGREAMEAGQVLLTITSIPRDGSEVQREAGLIAWQRYMETEYSDVPEITSR